MLKVQSNNSIFKSKNLLLWSMIQTLLQNLLSKQQQNSLSIGYGHIVAEKTPPYYYESITPFAFRKQIQFFKKHYQIIGLHEALSKLQLGESLNKCMILTFDDGFRCCYEVIAPILKEEQITATFFINTGTLDNEYLMWRNQLFVIKNKVSNQQLKSVLKAFNQKHTTRLTPKNLLAKSKNWAYLGQEILIQRLWKACSLPTPAEFLEEHRPYMTTPQVQTLLNAGFSIGGHTDSHPICTKLNTQELEIEIIESNQQLEAIFDVNILAFAYPFGERPKARFEQKIVQNSRLLTLLGVEEQFNNRTNPLHWERFKLEKSLFRTLLNRSILGVTNKW